MTVRMANYREPFLHCLLCLSSLSMKGRYGDSANGDVW